MKKFYILSVAGILILFSTGCKKFELVTKTIYTPSEISNITYNSVNVSTEILEVGDNLKTYGYCYGTGNMPTVEDDKTIYAGENAKTGIFTEQITELIPNTSYYVRVYSEEDEIRYSKTVQTFTTAPTTVTDYDGNSYNTVVIGNQVWMAENLKVTHYADGTEIPFISNNADWADLEDDDKGYCWYDDNESAYKNTYGALYTWAAAMGDNAVSSDTNPSGVQGVCPDDWHLPSDAEWKELEMELGMTQAQADATNWRGTDEGGKMKEAGTTHWDNPNTDATNESGFTALPGGYRHYDHGDFGGLGSNGYFWSATEYDATYTWYRRLLYDYSDVNRGSSNKSYGFSVRCLRD